MLINLLSNAIKFTPSGGTITLQAAVEDQVVVVSVTDTGHGIPAADLPRIGQPFERSVKPDGNRMKALVWDWPSAGDWLNCTVEAWRSEARKEPAPRSRCDCPCPSNSRLPDAIRWKSVGHRRTTERAGTRLIPAAGWTIAGGPEPSHSMLSRGANLWGGGRWGAGEGGHRPADQHG